MKDQSPNMTGFVRDAYDDIAHDYLTARRGATHDLPYLDDLVDQLQPGDRILDVGCGSGLPIAAHLASRGLEVLGVDISPVQIELARENVPQGQFFLRDVNDLEPGEFDVSAVVAFYSLIHVPREFHLQLLEVLRSFLPRGGRLLSTFGSTEWEGEELFFGAPMRWSHHGPEKSVSLVREAGFDIEFADMIEHRFEDEIERHLVISAVATDPD